jgi:hypothetical protein
MVTSRDLVPMFASTYVAVLSQHCQDLQPMPEIASRDDRVAMQPDFEPLPQVRGFVRTQGALQSFEPRFRFFCGPPLSLFARYHDHLPVRLP